MIRRTLPLVVVLALLVALAARPADGCTTFLLNDAVRFVFGKNYDWMIRSGMLVVNQRGVAKISIADAGGNPARWTSRYGSVSFNQFGRGFPMGGMNEIGLVVELMWLDETVYPPADDRATLDNLQWIQYQLDTAATVEDVLASNERVRNVSFLRDTPQSVLDEIAHYPESTVCVGLTRVRRPSGRVGQRP